MTNQYEFKPFVKMVQERLSLIHKVEGFEISKNKITFNVNGYPVVVQKDYSEDIFKTIVSCEDMFPYSFRTTMDNNKTMYFTYENVVRTVNAIDSYFMELIGHNSILCSKYQALKYLMLPFFIYDYRKKKNIPKLQEDILCYLANSIKSNSGEPQYFSFIGDNKKNNKRKRYYVLAVFNENCTLYTFTRNSGGRYELLEDEVLEIPYSSSEDGIKHVKMMRNALRNYTNFKMCDLDYTPYVEIVVDEEDIL